MARELDGHYRADGVVSVWIGTFPDEASYERYFREDWDDLDEDEFPSCPFWRDLGIRWFDHDFQEGGYVGTPVPMAELLGRGWSFVDSFREPLLARCAEGGIATANSVMFLFDYDYREESGYSCPHMTFIGVFSYKTGGRNPPELA
jgi:hypothetical protein